MTNYCKSCGKELDCSKEGECWSDGGDLARSHGMMQCKECYSKTHKFCPKCDIPMMPDWKYCPKCGNRVA